MKTNAIIAIYNLQKEWDGSVGDPVPLGNYEVWLENDTQYSYDVIDGQKIRTKIGDGFVILWEEIDLVDCYILIDDSRYDITDIASFTDARKKFHHMEFIYK